MYSQLLVSSVLISFVVADQLYVSLWQIRGNKPPTFDIIIPFFKTQSNYGQEAKPVNAVENKNNLGFPIWRQHFWKPPKNVHRNTTVRYIDRAENMIRLPVITKFNKNEKKKVSKKSPKRTVQKIIKKKNRQKTKKIYVIKMMTSPTVSPVDFDAAQDEMAQWKDESTTTPPNQRKKSRKYNYSKIPRYPMPFQRMQKMRNHKREKRGLFNREDLYILKDFNELKFLRDDNNDYSVVNTHVQKYW